MRKIKKRCDRRKEVSIALLNCYERQEMRCAPTGRVSRSNTSPDAWRARQVVCQTTPGGAGGDIASPAALPGSESPGISRLHQPRAPGIAGRKASGPRSGNDSGILANPRKPTGKWRLEPIAAVSRSVPA
ncbi:hypothetical protein Bbelb_233210 [Branchiostoma belcheri]|nr:hypothetical protein Bbelb_233210 [Branchiostoma belcheri]